MIDWILKGYGWSGNLEVGVGFVNGWLFTLIS